jgi:predicted nucleic acid-binding protein
MRFDTAQIGPLREIVAQIPALRALIGDILRLRLVVDANFVIGELIHRVRHPDRGASAFEELVKATVIDVFAPRWLETEMTTSTIPKAAKRSKVSETELRARWAEFRGLLKWDNSLRVPGVASSECCDPKDLPYILLQHKVNADGILTKDPHIARMGGHALTLDFVFSARGYARSAVTTVSIRVMGVVLPGVALMLLAELLRSVARLFGSLRDPVKALILVGGVVAFLHPNSRRWIADRCCDAYAMIAPAQQAFLEIVASLAAIGSAAEVQASRQLQEVTKAIRPRYAVAGSPSARRRRRTRFGTTRVVGTAVPGA